MLHKAWNAVTGKWEPSPPDWEDLGGTFSSPPAAVSWGANRIDVFGLGTDNQMYHRWWNADAGEWDPKQNWEGLGGTFNSPPAAVAWGPNRLDIFALGIDNQVLHKDWNGVTGAWEPSALTWESLAGGFHSAPAVASWAHDRLDVFTLGDDNAVWHRYWNGGAWQPLPAISTPGGWESLHGSFKVFTTPSKYRVVPIIWGTIFPPGVEQNWKVTPYTNKQYADAMNALFGTTYFSGLNQYGAAQVSLNQPIVVNDPWPAPQGKFTAVFRVDDVTTLLKNNFAKGAIPKPSQVVEGAQLYVVVLPAGSSIIVPSQPDGAHYFFPYPAAAKTSTGSELVLWAWVYGDGSLNGVMRTTTHEVLEAIGADTSAPRELCDGCDISNPNGALGPGGVNVSTYFDAANNRCIAPPNFP